MNRSTFSPFCWVNPLFPLENKAFLVHTLHGLLHITAIQSLFIYWKSYLQFRCLMQHCYVSGRRRLVTMSAVLSMCNNGTGEFALVASKVTRGERWNSSLMGICTWNVSKTHLRYPLAPKLVVAGQLRGWGYLACHRNCASCLRAMQLFFCAVPNINLRAMQII